MDKREKVIKGLECCSIGLYCPDEECPYEKDKEEKQENCIALLARDALELLKAQEPVKPIHLHNTKIHDSLKDVVFEDECGNCNGYLLRTWKACPICGKAVRWDG